MSRLACCLLLLCVVRPATLPLGAQEHDRDRPPPRVGSDAGAAAARTALLNDVRAEVYLPGLREYDMLLAAEARHIALRNMMMITLRLSGLQDDRRSPRYTEMDIIRANLGTNLALRRSSIDGWKAVGYLVLMLATQFAASYAKEALIGRNTGDLDYLHLPRAPGVVRTFSEAEKMALWRGGMQALETWYDFYLSVKNKAPCYPK